MKNKITKAIALIGTILSCSSCNDTNIIISKSYGDYNERKTLLKTNEIECTLSQVIDGSSCASNIYLNFIPQSNLESRITSINGQMKWQQNGKIDKSPFILCHVSTTRFNNTDPVADSSFLSTSLITDKFKVISGQNNSLLYNIEFCDTTYKPIPQRVDKVIIELEIDINSGGETKHFKKSVDLEAIISKNKIPPGRND